MAGGLPKGLRAKGLSKKRQKNFRQSAQPNQDGPQSVSNQSDNFSTLGATANPGLANSLAQKELFEVVGIKGKGLGCVASADIKRGALILNETPQMQFFGDTIIGAIQKGQVAEWINSVLTSFNKMNKANQLEFMTLCNIYDFQESPLCKKRVVIEMIVGERSPDLERWFEYNKLIKSQIDRVEKDPEDAEKIMKICNIFATNTFCRVGFKTARFNHSCQPNAMLIMERGQNQIRAIKDIKEGEEINISYLSNLDNLRKTKFRQNHLFYVWHFLCLCDWCKNNDFDTDEAFESLVQQSDLHQFRRSMFLSSKGDPKEFFPLEVCRSEVKCYKKMYEISRSLKIQDITLIKILEKGFEAAITGYIYHQLPEFDCDIQNFAKAANEFEKILGNEIITRLWKEKHQNFEMWYQKTVTSP